MRHYYYDQAGQVITETVEVGGKAVLDREYIWDVNAPGRLVCGIAHNVPGFPPGEEQRLYPLYDGLGRVAALADPGGNVIERYAHDPHRLVCRIRHNGSEERLYPLYDVSGNVVALVDEDQTVLERFEVDPNFRNRSLDRNACFER